MTRRKRSSDQQLLFDAPLRPEPAAASEDEPAAEPIPSSRKPPSREAEPDGALDSAGMLPLFPELEESSPGDSESPTELEGSAEDALGKARQGADDVPGAGAPASVGARLLAGLADLAIQATVLVLLLVGEHFLSVTPSRDQWPPLLLFMVAFSYVYTVIPLAFWRQTPGMTCFSLICVSRDDQNLSFGQTSLRWVGAWVSLVLVGLPILLALGGRSFSDWLSRSETLFWPEG